MSELKPCPFCGGKVWKNLVPNREEYGYYLTINCKCGYTWVFGPDEYPYKLAKEGSEAWNRRANDD